MSLALETLPVITGTTFDLNGVGVAVDAPLGARLSEVLRERLGRKDVKVGCNAGDCGACSILLDGEVVCACTTPLAQVEGRRVETLAGLVRTDGDAKRVAESLQKHGAAQCGVCTPGMMVAATALLRAEPSPDAAAVSIALSGVLCRCTGYRKIIDAVVEAGRPASTTASMVRMEGPGHVGEAMRRIDGQAKVNGEERFGDDMAPDGCLVVRIVRSAFPHAAFVFGDLDAFKARHPGVDLVLTAADVPGENRFGVIPAFADQPVFAEGIARFRGEAVAAVVGDAEAIAALDLSDFPVTFEERPDSATVTEALAPDATLLHPGRAGNVMCGGLVARGDLDAGWAGSDVTVEGAFETGFVEHAYIEPEAGFARRVGDRIEIHACTQAPYMDRDSMAEIMGLAPEAVRIVPTAVGGGFGSKLDLSVQPYIALAAWRLNRPVRIAYTRTESMQSTTKRHPSEIALKIGASSDGRITAFDFAGDFNTGAYASWGPTVANRVPVHASGPYLVPNYRARSRAVHTHCPPSGAFRGFGVPQSAVAQECLFDELADRLGIDRLEFRRINALKNGEPTVCGQVFEQGVGIGACLDALVPHWSRAKADAKAFNEAAERKGGPLRRGVGIASGWYGCGNTSMPNPSTIKAGIRADGTLVLHQGATDIGQGSNTVIAQIFATALGVPLDRVVLVGPDTDVTPDAGKTSASRQTFVTGNAARLAGEALRAEVLRLANVSADAQIELGAATITVVEGAARRTVELSKLAVDADGYVLAATRSYDPPTKPLDANGQGSPYAVFGYAAHLVELDVDLGLGTVKLVKFTAAHDVGKAINPILVEGQVQGGIAQGVGMALMEEYLPGRTENLHDYLIPTTGDIPPIETLIVEEADAHGPYGAKGLGEHVLIPTAPAILNAIRDASGARIRKLPATPDRVLSAIRAAQAAGGSEMVKQVSGPSLNGKIRCDACPVMCYIAEGRSGACDRYANEGGELIRVDPFTIIEHAKVGGGKVVPFLSETVGLDDVPGEWDGDIVHSTRQFITAIGAGTTYPDYKPAPFIVSQEVDGVDMVTVVTEGIFSYCGAKVKIDTDRHVGAERSLIRAEGEAVGHVTTGEYGSQMLSFGGVHHLTGGSKKEGRVTCDVLLRLCNGEAVEVEVDHGARLVLQAGKAPVVDGVLEHRMRVGCGSATIGMFAKQWLGHVDEVVVVDDHITGVLSEHQAGKLLDIPPTGIRIKGRRSTPGRYFQVAEPGTGWGGTNISDPLTILGDFDPKVARPGMTMLMVSTTGEQFGYYVLDELLRPVEADLPAAMRLSVERIAENCEPALASVLFMGGAGGSLRAGVTENPVRLTRSVKDALTYVSCGGAPAYVWPGGGITVMADVTKMPSNAFGYVPTPALVAPIEFTMRRDDYARLGGHVDAIVPMGSVVAKAERHVGQRPEVPWPTDDANYRWPKAGVREAT